MNTKKFEQVWTDPKLYFDYKTVSPSYDADYTKRVSILQKVLGTKQLTSKCLVASKANQVPLETFSITHDVLSLALLVCVVNFVDHSKVEGWKCENSLFLKHFGM